MNNKKLFIWWAKPIEGTGNIGEIVSTNLLCIGTGKGLLQLEKLQFENEAELDAKKHLLIYCQSVLNSNLNKLL